MEVVNLTDFIAKLRTLAGLPYIWDGKDGNGLDCSGCMSYAYLLAGGEDVRNTHNCREILTECVKIDKSTPATDGMLCLYGPKSEPQHVMAYLDRRVFGSCGGGRSCTSPEEAKRLSACVQYRSKVNYRPDSLGLFRWQRINYDK